MRGETIGQYRIIDKLGAGGMGEVFLAEDTKLKRKVALKFLPESLSAVAEARARFEREARAQAALSHPNVVVVHDVAVHNGRPFIVMEHIDGMPLGEYCLTESPSVSARIRLAIGIAEGLAAAHRASIIHRDLKPANILVASDGRAKICDFGLAHARAEAQITRDGSTLGTAAYMSPEQAQGQPVDQRSDLFSFGSVLYEMLTGQRAFAGEHEAAVVYSIIHDDPEPLSRWGSDVPRGLEEVIERSLKKKPDERYGSADELLAALREVKRSLDGGVAAAGQTDRDAPSIAVLPFTNMSADPENEYFSDGLAEELINALTKIPQLHVAARTSSFAFKGRELDIREIGRKLGVGTVLEGSVRRAGKRLRVTAQLINVTDGYHLWAERYDREMEDVFAIQDEISGAIVSTLKVRLVGEDKRPQVRRPTANVEAYSLYLRGRHFWSGRTEDGLQRAIDCYQQAIALDPRFTLAHVGIADCRLLSCSYQFLSPADSIPYAREAAARAMTLDSESAEAYESRAHVHILDDWDWSAAERDFRRAIALDPGYATARNRLGLLLSLLGRIDAALEESETARALEPMSLIINNAYALRAFERREFDRALNLVSDVLEMKTDFGPARMLLGQIYEQLGDYQRAVAELHRAKSALGSSSVASGQLGHAYAKWGNDEEARLILEELHELSARRFVSPLSFSMIHLGLGETEQALEWLARAVDQRSVWMIHLHVASDPRLDAVRDNPSFTALLGRMNLSAAQTGPRR